MQISINTDPAQRAAQEAQALAKAYVVDGPEMAELAGNDLRKLTAEYKRVEEMRLSVTRPMDEAKKAAIAAFKPYLEKIKDATDSIRGELNRYLLEERQREEERQRREEEERQRQIEELRETAAAAEDNAAMIEQLQDLESLPVTREAPTKIAGISQRTSWKVKKVDLRTLVEAAAKDPDLLVYLKADEVEIGKVVRALRDRHRIPGVTAEEVTGLSVRS